MTPTSAGPVATLVGGAAGQRRALFHETFESTVYRLGTRTKRLGLTAVRLAVIVRRVCDGHLIGMAMTRNGKFFHPRNLSIGTWPGWFVANLSLVVDTLQFAIWIGSSITTRRSAKKTKVRAEEEFAILVASFVNDQQGTTRGHIQNNWIKILRSRGCCWEPFSKWKHTSNRNGMYPVVRWPCGVAWDVREWPQ